MRKGYPLWSHGCACAGDLRREEAGRDGGHDDKGGEAVDSWGRRHVWRSRGSWSYASRWESDGRVAEDAEVEGVVRVLPDVLAADDSVLAEGLLEAGVELIAKAGTAARWRRRASSRAAGRARRWAALTGKDEILVERSFQRARIGDAEDGIGALDVVSDTESRLGLASNGQAVVEIAANAEIEEPVSGLDLVLQIERELLDVGVAEVEVVCCRRG